MSIMTRLDVQAMEYAVNNSYICKEDNGFVHIIYSTLDRNYYIQPNIILSTALMDNKKDSMVCDENNPQ